MSQDFIDDAVESLKAGQNPFVLLTLSRAPNGEILWHIRSGHIEDEDLSALKDLVKGKLMDYVEEME